MDPANNRTWSQQPCRTVQRKGVVSLPMMFLVIVIGLAPSVSLAAPLLGDAGGCPGMMEGEICCGGVHYRQDNMKVCCPLLGHSPGTMAYVFASKCVLNRTDSSMETCGVKTFDSRFDICCSDTIYRTSDYYCCMGGRGPTAAPRGASCCDGQPLMENQLCCDVDYKRIPVNKTHELHNTCCAPRNPKHPEEVSIKTFDSSTHICDGEGNIGNILDFGDDSFPNIDVTEEPSPKKKENRVHSLGNLEMKSLVDIWWPPAKECLSGQNEFDEDGEELACCGQESFKPSQKRCCDRLLYDFPSRKSVCCMDKAYRKGDLSNPCLSVCGDKQVDSERQLCCDGRVVEASPRSVCCGRDAINLSTQICCGDVVIERNGPYSCCGGQMPYLKESMRCEENTGRVVPRTKLLSDSIEQICKAAFPFWGDSWRPLYDPTMSKVVGRVDGCGIKVKGDTLTITLTPAVALGGGHGVSRCLNNRGLKLKIPVEGCQVRKALKKAIRQQLKGATLDVFFKNRRRILRCKRGWGVLDLKQDDVVLMLQSRRMDRAMRDASSISL